MTLEAKPSVGLLPFYLMLYDEVLPACRESFAGYQERLVTGLEARGIAVRRAPICRVAGEFADAVRQFEKDRVDAIVTLHLAYSPSLEAVEALCGTSLPIVMLDATMDAGFGVGVAPERLMQNHGIHGVMDLASVLRRRSRPYEIVAGHDSDPRTLDRVAGHARAACAARSLRGTRALRVGPTFKGMGDFQVDEAILSAALGIGVREIDLGVLDEAVRRVTDEAVAGELAGDRARFLCSLPAEAHERSVRVGLGLRRVLEEGGHSAFSVNFQAFDRADRPANTMPFLEVSKAMERGIGYAGEGDVLTAALVGALARAFGEVTFTEVFCPDWSGDSLFLSHMGEISPAVAGDRPRLVAKPPFSGGSLNPAILTCAVKPGSAVFVNLAPGPNDSFSLIVAPVEVLAEDASLKPAMRDIIRAWVRPRGTVGDFLEAYSRAGGTHHSALLLGDHGAAVAAFGRLLGVEVCTIQ